MANPLYQALGNVSNPQNNKRNLAPNLLQFIQGFHGNPLETLQNKLNSGEMSQQQYDQLHGIAVDIAKKMAGVLSQK